MGQKTEFILEDWDFPEEGTDRTDSSLESSDTDFIMDADEALSLLEQESSASLEQESSASFEQEFSASSEPLSEEEQNDVSDEVNIVLNNAQSDARSLFEVHGNKININANDHDLESLTQEEEAFRRQIEDLFELLEMEKAADKSDGIRVYQTDSSPSRPWRFH